MKTILVTGGSGFIGSHTCVSLLENGYKIIIIDSNINSSKKSLERVKNIAKVKNKEFEEMIFKKGDIRNQDFLRDIFKGAKSRNSPIDAVIHFAGLKSVEESVKNPIQYWDNNVYGSIVLLKIMSEFNCFCLVFSSSATIYGNVQKKLINEQTEINPINPYGNNKYAIELLLKDIFKSKENSWRISNLRYFNPIGAHPSGLIGEEPFGRPNNLFPFITGVGIGKYKELKIFGNDWPTKDGTCVRDYIHVVDLAEAHTETLNYLLRNKPQIINLNIGRGVGTSVLDLVKTFQKVNKCKIPYVFSDRRNGDVSRLIADNKKALSLLSWKPKRNLSEMCMDGFNWQRLNPYGYR